MRRLWLLASLAALTGCLSAHARAEQPQKVSVCQLMADPPAYNHKLVEVQGFVSHGFEDFTLFDPLCPPSAQDIWLEYGGTPKCAAVYCFGPAAGTARPEELTEEGIPIPLVDNVKFEALNKEIQPPFRSGDFGSIVYATLVGRFFAGRKMREEHESGKGPAFGGGFGDMGCCSLLAIQEVESVFAQNRDDLDYGASADEPDIGKEVGCGCKWLTTDWPRQGDGGVEAEKEASQSPDSYAFDDSERVASSFLVAHLKLDASQPLQLTEKRKAQGRVVYAWDPPGKGHSYMVVVSKPFLLSLYSHDPKRVAWVVIAAYDSSCDGPNSVIRPK